MILLESKNIIGKVKDAMERKNDDGDQEDRKECVSIETVGKGLSVPVSSSFHSCSSKNDEFHCALTSFKIL